VFAQGTNMLSNPPRRRLIPASLFAALLACIAPVLAQDAGSLPRTTADNAGFAADKLVAIDQLLQAAVDKGQIAGGAALVARRGKLVHLATIGMQDAEARIPISASTIYRIASMTKPITSVAAMMLAEEGKLRLDDPVSKFIPEFAALKVLTKDAQPDQPLNRSTTTPATIPTVRHLLTHTSGITYSFWNHPILAKLYRETGVSSGLIETPGTMTDNCRRLAALPLMFEPGTAWEYGLNTDVLGRVVEVASGKTLDRFFQQRILQPLGMRDTHFVLPAAKQQRLAALYAPDEAKKISRVDDKPQNSVSAIGVVQYSATYPLAEKSQYQSGGAGLVSTIGDYARFLQMLANGGQLDGARLLKAETIAQMTTNQIGDLSPTFKNHGDKFGYGFGVVTAASKPAEPASIGSYSWGGVFYTYFLVDPEKELIALCMAQVFPWDHLTLHGDFKNAVYAALLN
jgi:CubicO group peptidase (beta-lactamase class C family)